MYHLTVAHNDHVAYLFCRMKLNSVYEYVEGKIGGAFGAYGRFISRHAWKVIIITVLVNALLGVGMMNLKSNVETDNVYLPQSMYI